VKVRAGTREDLPLLEDMLVEAALWNPRERRAGENEILSDPRIKRYVEGWGRSGDAAVVAVDGRGNAVGAAWYRLLPAAEPGYGFVAESVPEVSIAVRRPWRRRGVGSLLLAALLARARAEGFDALSLSVSPDNPAVSLYERFGFERAGEAEGSWTMTVRL